MFRFVKTPFRLSLLTLAVSFAFVGAPAMASPLGLPTQPRCAVASTTLSLAQAAELALCNQSKTREAYAQIRLAQANAAESRAIRGPQLTAGLGLNQTESSSPALTGTAQQTQLKLSYVLLDFGRSTARQEAAQFLETAARLEGTAQTQAVLLEVSSRYFSLMVASMGKVSAEEAVSAARQSLSSAKARFEAGDAARADVLQAQAAVDEAVFKLAQAQGTVRIANGALAVFIGAPAAQILAVDDPSSSQPPSLSLAPANELPSLEELLKQVDQRGEVQADARRVQAAQRSLAAAELATKPSLSASATSNWQQLGSGPGSHSANIGLTLEIPLFDSGLTKSRISQARAQLEAAQARSLSQYRAIEQELVQAHVRVQTSFELTRAAASFLRSSSEAEAQAQGRYQAGVSTLQDWLTVQAKVAAAREQMVSAHAQLLQSRVELARAVGTLTLDVF